MATPNLSELVYTGFAQSLDSWMGRQLAIVDRVLAEHHLQPCVYPHPHFEYPCGKTATVSDLDSRQGLCVRHFRAVNS